MQQRLKANTILGEDMWVTPFPSLSPRPLLQAFDEHMNLVLGNAEETFTYTEVNPATGEAVVKVSCRL